MLPELIDHEAPLVTVLVDTPKVKESEKSVLLQDKYQRLLLQNQALQKNNTELEDRLLNVVEKTEREKLLLSEEIDEVSNRLRIASNNVTRLDEECSRYKKDCVLAVHLLQCQPTAYIAQKLQSTQTNGNNENPRKLSKPVVATPTSYSTFPPTAIFYNDAQNSETESQPEDPEPPDSPMSNSQNLTLQFVDKIRSQNEYKVVEMRQCSRCGHSVNTCDVMVQTERLTTLYDHDSLDKRKSRCDSCTSSETNI